jgi:hypothetical protein
VKGHKNHMKDEMSFARFKLKQSHVKSKLQNYEQGHKCLCHRKYDIEGLQWIVDFICSLPLFTTFNTDLVHHFSRISLFEEKPYI